MSPVRSRIQTVSDVVTEGLIYFMVIFSPWAFGTTQRWSIWTLNVAGYLLGGALALKWIERWHSRSRAEGEDAGFGVRRLVPALGRPARRAGEGGRFSSRITIFQAILTVLILAYCLVSALNARATYDASTQQFVYHQCLDWLPHSYDSHSSRFAFWNYLALALSFWAIRDWLGAGRGGERERGRAGERAGGKAGVGEWGSGEAREREREFRDQRSEVSGQGAGAPPPLHHSITPSPSHGHLIRPAATFSPSDAEKGSPPLHHSITPSRLPRRWQRLFWVLCLNGALLGLECLLQRIEGTGKLLWLVEPRINKDAASQFGPYAYRSNAAQYFNLLWPACLGFWWMLHRAHAGSGSIRGQSGPRAYGVILPCVLLMAACAIASLSRGGALVAIIEMIAASVILVFSRRERGQFWRAGLAITGVFVLVLFLSGFLDWPTLYQRFSGLTQDPTSGRADIYRHALVMAQDFSLWGSGPKTFSPLYQLYFTSPDQDWVAQVHNDWLETWITFGGVGFSLIMLTLLLVFCRYFFFHSSGVVVPWPFTTLLWLGLVGCLCFAAVDFPFQITSILFLFLVLCAISSSLSRRSLSDL